MGDCGAFTKHKFSTQFFFFLLAVDKPLFKKQHLHPSELSNYHAFTITSFLSKFLDIHDTQHSVIVGSRNNKHCVIESVSWMYHSTEYVLAKVIADLILGLDSGYVAVFGTIGSS